MAAEETVAADEGVEGQAAAAHLGADPCGVVVMVAVAVEAVVHNLAVMDLVEDVYLPEDDTAVACHAESVAPGGMLHLLHGEVAHGHRGAAEKAERALMAFD